jgi:hypothetical protein
MKNKLYNLYFFPITLLLGSATSFLGAPWWIGSIVGFIAAYLFPLSQLRMFLLAFSIGFLLWAGSAFYLDSRNAHQLSTKMGVLLGGAKDWQLVFLTGFIGGLLAFMGAWIGRIAKNNA